MYDLTVPVMLRGFAALSTYLGAAEQFVADNHIDPSVLLHARLAPDMMDFTAQIQRASDNAKGGAGRLTGLAVPSFADDETSIGELRARVDRTVRS